MIIPIWLIITVVILLGLFVYNMVNFMISIKMFRKKH